MGPGPVSQTFRSVIYGHFHDFGHFLMDNVETPDTNNHSAPASTPSSLPSGGYGIKVIPGTVSHPGDYLLFDGNKSKNANAAAKSKGSVNAIKDKLKKDKDRAISFEKEKKK